MQPEGRSFDPEIDLLRRYESMIRIQVETIDGIDEKAAVTGRLTTMLVGLVMTAASILLTTAPAVLTRETVIPLVMFGISLVFLLAALLFAIITYLSSSFRYGPSATIGRYMAAHQVTTQDYTSTLLDGYSSALDQNRAVVRANAVRFTWSHPCWLE